MLFLFTRKTRSSANMETADANSVGVIQSMALVIILFSIWPVMEKSAADFILQLKPRHHFTFYSFFSPSSSFSYFDILGTYKQWHDYF